MYIIASVRFHPSPSPLCNQACHLSSSRACVQMHAHARKRTCVLLFFFFCSSCCFLSTGCGVWDSIPPCHALLHACCSLVCRVCRLQPDSNVAAASRLAVALSSPPLSVQPLRAFLSIIRSLAAGGKLHYPFANELHLIRCCKV